MQAGRNNHRRASRGERGGVLVAALLTISVLLGLSGVVMRLGVAQQGERHSAQDDVRALYLAESALNETLARLTGGNTNDLGSPEAPLALSGGAYWADVTANGDGTFTVVSSGRSNGRERAIEAVLAPVGGGVFSHALFAGNKSGDPMYRMTFGGLGNQGDQIHGDIFSGGHVVRSGDAAIHGTIRAHGLIVGGEGETGVTQPIPDLAGMNYPGTADVHVATLFQSASWRSDDAGGSAWQLPSSSPAHIFRKNPNDRSAEINSTAKDDYFLEDPYTPVTTDASQNGSNAFQVTLHASGNNAVYYIDGNLWLHNKKTYSFKVVGPNGQPVKATFVVRGNIYFSDNLFYNDPQQDGLAFIAMEDPALPGTTGNIYFGDPEFGTLGHMSGFMYAENNFYDTNLDASGSSNVRVHGNMTAGNHVAINRDFNGQHSQLVVDFDDRIVSGQLEMPGLPSMGNGTVDGYTVISWREVAAP